MALRRRGGLTNLPTAAARRRAEKLAQEGEQPGRICRAAVAARFEQISDAWPGAAAPWRAGKDFDLALRRTQPTGENSERGGFTGALRAQQPKDLSPPHIETDIDQCAHQAKVIKEPADAVHEGDRLALIGWGDIFVVGGLVHW